MDKKYASIPLQFLLPSPENVRHAIEDDALEKLSQSILNIGQQVEIIVCAHESRQGYFEVIDGHRRRLALIKAGVAEAKCVILASKPSEFDLLCIRSSLGNTAAVLTALENADTAQKIMRLRPEMSQAEVAAMMGISTAQLSKCLTLSEDGSPNLHAAVAAGEVPVSAGTQIARLKDRFPEQDALVERYKAGLLKRDTVVDEVNRLLGKKPPKEPKEPKSVKLRIGNLVLEFVGEKVEQLTAEVTAFLEKLRRCAKPSDSLEALPVLLKRQ